jgi:hypothetical protein
MVEIYENRDDERATHKVPVLVEDLEDGSIYRGRMVDYSKSGMYLETDVILDMGAEIHIGIENSPYTLSSSSSQKAPQYFRAKIRWQKDLKDNLFNFGYGVRILSIGDLKSIGDNNFKVRRNLRKYPRKPYFKPIFFTSENQHYKGLINDISQRGVFVETKNSFSIGQIIRFVIPGTKIDKGVMLKGEIVRFDNTGIGVEFKSLLRKKKN